MITMAEILMSESETAIASAELSLNGCAEFSPDGCRIHLTEKGSRMAFDIFKSRPPHERMLEITLIYILWVAGIRGEIWDAQE
jgi:hypothetical protein